MILFKDDSNLSLKVITTVQNKKEYRRNCKFINNKFYLMNEDCFFVDGLWYRKESGKIEYDNEKKQWVLKSKNQLINGVIDVKGGELTMGWFSPNVFTNCKMYHSALGTVICQNLQLLKDNNYIEDISSCKWYHKNALTTEQVKKMSLIRNERNYTDKGYNIEDNGSEFERKKQSYKDFPTEISKDVRKYAKFLGDLTYGYEIEAIRGTVDEVTQYKNGLVICRDGSLNGASGPEIVGVPMSGAKGVQTLINTCNAIQKRTEIDINCSLHFHIGNVLLSREYVVALYVLSYKIQNELFEMFPFYKTDPRGVKQKNYCQKLKKMQIHLCKDCSKEGFDSFINETFIRIFTFLSDGHPPSEDVNVKVHQHPIRYKWERKHSRYVWSNLQNMLFSERFTWENRLHTPTLNPVKAVNWLYMSVAIVKYAENNIRKILCESDKISLKEVLNYFKDHYPSSKDAAFISEYLNAYYSSRRREFNLDLEKEKPDFISQWDIDEDQRYNFELNGKKLF